MNHGFARRDGHTLGVGKMHDAVEVRKHFGVEVIVILPPVENHRPTLRTCIELIPKGSVRGTSPYDVGSVSYSAAIKRVEERYEVEDPLLALLQAADVA